jgi:flagellar export protein FliJ
MAASKSLERLLGIRQAEEERSQQELKAAIQELQRLELAHATTHERGKRARTLVASSAQTGEIMDRIAGLQEMATADRLKRMLLKKIDAARKDAQHNRQELLTRRLARRQVETLVDSKSTEARAEANRKTQSTLDDWHRSQRKPEMRKADAARFESDIPLTK